MNFPSMMPATLRLGFLGLSVAWVVGTGLAAEAPPPWKGDVWRAHRRLIDMHQHIEGLEERFERALRINDRVGIGVAVNLSGGTVTHKPGEISEFEKVAGLARKIGPDRFLSYFNLDYSGLDDPDFSERAVQQVDEAYRLGAAGFKEYKRLGLTIRNKAGEILGIDDPKLDPVWKRCGELKMPVSIHVADPKAFWLPYSQQNERWKELKDHPKWWFGDPKQFPSREQLLAALDRVIVRHTNTTFVCVHFANNSEDLDWVERMLDTRPNMSADLAARIPELGRHDPERVRRLFIKHQDRIFFATDFQVYSRLILGSAGDAERPTDEDAAMFFRKEWRWLETKDRDWPHMTPIQGDWNISSIGLPSEVLRKIYFDNARRLLVRSLPFTRLSAARISEDFPLQGRELPGTWSRATPFPLEQQTQDGKARVELSTMCRVLWSDRFLYLQYVCPFKTLTVYPNVQKEERIINGQALWDKDVVEAFIGTDPAHPDHYTEYEWAPNGESLDLRIRRPNSDFAWSSGMESVVTVDEGRKVWKCSVRIPLSALSETAPQVGTKWRMNLYRIDRAHKAFLASNPTLNGSFHTFDRFGWLEFEK